MGDGGTRAAAPGTAPDPGAGVRPRSTTAATVVVVGGGIAGLSAAWALSSAHPGLRVMVVESDARLGGKLLTGEVGGRAVDLGPDAFLARRPEATALCDELGLTDELVAPGSRTAYVWSRGRLRPLPAGLALGVPTRLGPLARSGIVSPLGVGRAAVDLLGWPLPSHRPEHRGPDRAVGDITRRRLGREVTAQLVDPLIGGIHAGDTAAMSSAAVFPSLLEAAHHGGSLMRALRTAPGAPAGNTGSAGSAGPVSPGGPDGQAPVFLTVRGGLSRLVDRLTDSLGARGVELRTRCRVGGIERRGRGDEPAGAPTAGGGRWALDTTQGTVEADAVVIAVPAGPAAELLRPLDPGTASLLGAIAYADVTLVTLRLPEKAVGHPLEGTGFLVPAGGGRLVTACTWLTSKWPDIRRPGDVLLRASTGRFGDDRAAAMSDDAVAARVVEELTPVLGIRGEPLEAVVTRWPAAFPQYDVGHLERVAAIEAGVASFGSMALAGAALGGVGIPACIGSGRRAAEVVLGAATGTGGSLR